MLLNNMENLNQEPKILKIEDVNEGDLFTFKSEGEIVTVRALPVMSWAKPEISVMQVGGPLNGRIFENVPLTELTRKEEE